jgi:fructose 1,6-bisphosphatase
VARCTEAIIEALEESSSNAKTILVRLYKSTDSKVVGPKVGAEDIGLLVGLRVGPLVGVLVVGLLVGLPVVGTRVVGALDG